jgi:hypothetical protein
MVPGARLPDLNKVMRESDIYVRHRTEVNIREMLVLPQGMR